jgi:hypothetical protein
VSTWEAVANLADIYSGEQLETVHIERQRAQAAYDLIGYYNQFAREDTSRLDALKKEGREGRRQVAIILRCLNVVAKEVDLPLAEQVLRFTFFLTHDCSPVFRF